LKGSSVKKISIVTTLVFGLIIFGLALARLLLPDAEFSRAERRLLAKPPAINAENFAKKYEDYAQDQFPVRQTFRTVNALTNRYVLGRREVNGLYYTQGHLSKLEYPPDPAQWQAAGDRINGIYNRYLKGMRCYYAIIPDKNYFLAKANGFLSFDYSEIFDFFQDNIKNIEYVDIRNELPLEAFYKTDIHWRQETVVPVAYKLLEEMDAIPLQRGGGGEAEEMVELAPFYGGYYGQAALPTKSETLFYIKNNITEKTVVHSAETKGPLPVYAPGRFTGPDPYDVFLHGPQALLTLETPAETTKELIIFRDSFASSLAPLLLGAYSKITLVDLRYIDSRLLPQFIEFADQDVLFLYATSILNNGLLLR